MDSATPASPGKKAPKDEDEREVPSQARFSPEEEADLLAQSSTARATANQLFTTSRFSEAISAYDRALSLVPNYCDYEIAVLRSNIAAAQLRSSDWKAAAESAENCLECLDRVEGIPRKKRKEEVEGEGGVDAGKAEKRSNGGKEGTKDAERDHTGADGGIVEIEGEDEEVERQLAQLKLSDERKEDVRRIRSKGLMRRAKAKEELGGWGNLAAAEEDYKTLSKMSNLPAQDKKVVQKALISLPTRINIAKEQEMGEMMGKLKDLGNGILKPFGLSTDMFKMNKDPSSGGYSMSFDQGSK